MNRNLLKRAGLQILGNPITFHVLAFSLRTGAYDSTKLPRYALTSGAPYA